MSISRRHFLEAAAATPLAAFAAVDKKTGMPQRILGKTGAQVSVLAFGGGSRFLAYKEEDKAIEALNRAIDLGISYVDSAYAYGNGLSEERVGKVMKTRRKEVWLTTKVSARNGDEAMRIIEGSLKRLQTSQTDLIHIHSLLGPDDLAAIEAKGGVLETLYKVKEQKMTRFIGITSHTDPAVLKTALERHDFDCTQMALNAARVGMMNGKGGMVMNPGMAGSFEALALPVANRKKMGIIAMKIFGQEQLVGKAPIDKLIHYALSLPVSCAVLGMPRIEFIAENIGHAKGFKPLPKDEMRSLADGLKVQKAELDRFFANHIDA